MQRPEPHKDLSLIDIEGEEWREIFGFEGVYEISNFGRIKSLARTVYRNDGVYVKIKEKIRKLRIVKEKGSVKKVRVHLQHLESNSDRVIEIPRAVWVAFANANDIDKVFHIDGDFLNNHISNLKEYIHNPECKIQISHILHGVENRKKNSSPRNICLWKGVSRMNHHSKIRYRMVIMSKEHSLNIKEYFSNELEAAQRYDYYIQKYNLKRKGNFIR